MTTSIKPAKEYTADEMVALLGNGAAVADSRHLRAAVHLLAYTALPGRVDFAGLVEIEEDTLNGKPVTVAYVTDWHALAAREGLLYLTGGELRLVNLAASMARGVPAELRRDASDLGTAHARRVLEATAICLGVDEYYAITDTPALIKQREQRDKLARIDTSY